MQLVFHRIELIEGWKGYNHCTAQIKMNDMGDNIVWNMYKSPTILTDKTKGDSTISSVQLLNIKWFGNQQTNHTDIQWNNVDDRNETVCIFNICHFNCNYSMDSVPCSMKSKFNKSFLLKKFQSSKIHSENWLDLEFSCFVFLKTFPAFNKFPSNFLSSFPFGVIQSVFYTTKLSKFEGSSDFACSDDVINTKSPSEKPI